jgi:exosortase N
MIVILQSKPETVMHELVGLLSFGIYFILPMYFITKWIIKAQPNFNIKKVKSKAIPSKATTKLFTIVLISSLAYFNFNRMDYRNIEVDNKSSNIEILNYTKSITKENVIKFKNNNALIYIKPSCHFFGPDHSPTICWKGSGYEFVNIDSEKLGAYQIYKAELKKGNETLYTAWWFDNGKNKTISQLNWRWKTAIGEEPYRLINITSTSKNELNNGVNSLLYMNLFDKNKTNINLISKVD